MTLTNLWSWHSHVELRAKSNTSDFIIMAIQGLDGFVVDTTCNSILQGKQKKKISGIEKFLTKNKNYL